MRKILTLLTLLLANSIFAQLAPGKYSYRNKEEARITFTIAEDGKINDCIIKGTSDISRAALRQYREKSIDKKMESWLVGTGEFIKNVTDPVGYYIVLGEFPTYEIRLKKSPATISIIIEGVKLSTFEIETK